MSRKIGVGRRSLAALLLVVACGTDTIGRHEATPGVESKVSPDSGQGGTRAKPTDAIGGKPSSEAQEGTSAAPPNSGADGGAESSDSAEPDRIEQGTEDEATVQSALSREVDPAVKYWFNESGTLPSDSSGNRHAAMLENGASLVAGARGNAVRIAGGTQRVALPAGVVKDCEDVTVALRVRLSTNSANWARIFDFGSDTSKNMFLTARAGASNALRFAITTGGGRGEQQLNYAYDFPTNTWKHLAVVLSKDTGTMYLDGVEVAQNTSMTLNPSALGVTANNWLGDSQHPADPTLDGTIDDVVVSCRAYSAAEIAWLASGIGPGFAQSSALFNARRQASAETDETKDDARRSSDAGGKRDSGGSNEATETKGVNLGAGGEAHPSGEPEVLELPPGWTPNAINPAAWYFASTHPSDVVEEPAGKVRTWLDRSGNARHLENTFEPGRPQFQPSPWNINERTVRFLGGQLLQTGTWSGSPLGTNASFTVLAVLRSTDVQGTGVETWSGVASFWSDFGDGVWASVRNTGELTLLDTMRLDDGSSSQMHRGHQDLGSATGLHVVAWRFSSSTQTFTLTVDGTHSVSSQQPALGLFGAMSLYVGATSPLPTGLLKGDISELVIVPSALSDEDVQLFREYAQGTWAGVLTTNGTGPCLKFDGSPSPDKTRCDDGNPDTIGDNCSAGTCAGATPPPGSPKELSPHAWYYASEQDIVITGGGVSTWYDRAPGRQDLLNGYVGKPTYVVNGWDADDPTIHFSGAQNVRRSGWLGAPTGTEQPFTVLAVMRSSGNQNSGLAGWWAHNSSRLVCQTKMNGSETVLGLFRQDGVTNANQQFLGDIALGTTSHAVAWRYADGILKLTVDGTTRTLPQSPIGAITPETFFLGADNPFWGLYSGDVSELAIIPRSITDTELARFDDYAQGEWGGLTLCVPNCAGQPNGAANGCGGTCDEPGDPGDPCTQTSQCQQGLECTNGTCTCPAGAPCSALCPCGPGDGPCQESSQCQSGLSCTNGTCIGGHCSNGDKDGDETDVDCGGSCASCAVGKVCLTQADCGAGFICWENQGRRFDKAGGTSVCTVPECAVDPYALNCGAEDSVCGRHCTNEPRRCTTDADCASTGEICGKDNGYRFGLARDADVCWPTDCTPPAANPARCGTGDSACGTCDCSANCAGRACGDSIADGCGGYCPGLCDDGEEGCNSNFDCPSGSVCARGAGPRFGYEIGTSVCWPEDCMRQDPTLPNGGVDPARCGTSPACVPECPSGFKGPDGCGGFCDACSGNDVRLDSGYCGNPSGIIARAGTAPPLPLPAMFTDEAGATVGAFAVNNRGQASYSVPIEVPPGRLGVQPNLALQYTSSKSNGMLSIGWSLAGLSSITRCGNILGANGYTTPVQLANNDRFCLDGKRLVVEGDGEYGEDGTEYRTEVESFSRIISRGDDDGNPLYFEVFTRDGQHLTYGLSELARVRSIRTTRTWALESVEDRSQNWMEIRYLRHQGSEIVVDTQGNVYPGASTGEIVPDVIAYGGNRGATGEGAKHTRFVKFRYEERTDVVSHYVAAGEAWSTLRVKEIQTSVAGERVKTYYLRYQDVPPTGVPSQLEEIKECGPDPVNGEACKRPTTFEYYRETNAIEQRSAIQFTQDIFPGGGLPFCNCTQGQTESPAQCAARTFVDGKGIVYDANGDGRDDILMILNWYGQHCNAPGGTEYGRVVTAFSTPTGFTQVQGGFPFADLRCASQEGVADFNRDGKDDFLDLCQPMLHLSNGDASFTNVPLGNVPYTDGMDELGKLDEVIKLADLSGDGLRDIIWCKDSGGHADIKAARALNFSGPVQPCDEGCPPDPPGPPNFADPAEVPDVVGKCEDLMVFDVDLDGDSDLLMVRASGGMRLYEGGSGTLEGPNLPGSWTIPGPGLPDGDPRFSSDASKMVRDEVPAGDFALLDLNGDGLKDILARVITTTVTGSFPLTEQEQKSEYIAWMNHGIGIFEPETLRVEFADLLDDPFPSLTGGLAIDYDGDGREELLVQHGASLRMVRPRVLEIGFGASTFVLRYPWLRRHFADFNGDGDLELLSEDGTSYTTSWRSARSRLLKSVTDGLGKRIEVEYEGEIDEFDSAPTYSKASCVDDRWTICQRRAGPLVSEHREMQLSLSTGDILKEGETIFYTYRGARVALDGRGPLGFYERLIFSEHSNTTLTFENDQFSAIAGLLVHRTVRYDENPETELGLRERRAETTDFDWTIMASASGQRTVGAPFLTKTTREVRELVSNRIIQRVVDDPVPDSYGNVAERTTNVYVGSDPDPLATITTLTPRLNDPNTWLLGLVDSEETTYVREFLEVGPEGTPVTDSQGRKVKYGYSQDSRGILTRIEREPDEAGDPDSTVYRKTVMVPDAFGNTERICDSDSRGAAAERCTEVETWDEDRIYPREIRDAEGFNRTFQIAADGGEIVSATDPNGIVSKSGYDAFGRLQQLDGPRGRATVRYFEGAPIDSGVSDIVVHTGQIIVTRVEGGGEDVEIIDAFQNVVARRTSGFDGELVFEEFERDAFGRVIRENVAHASNDPSQGTRRYAYDSLDRLIRVTDPDERATEIYHVDTATLRPGYTWFGGAAVEGTVVKLPRGNTKAVLRDPLGLSVVSHEAPGVSPGGEVRTTYLRGAYGRLMTSQSPSGNTSFDIDSYGRNRRINDPAMGIRTFVHNGFDELVETTNAENVTHRLVYDRLGRPSDKLDASGNPIAHWEYDGDGPNELGRLVGSWRRTEQSPTSGNWVRYRFRSDTRGLPEGIDYHIGADLDDPDGGEVSSIDLRYRTDLPWRLDGLDYPDEGGAFGVTYDYDSVGNVRAISSTENPNLTYWELLEADQGFRLGRETFGNGAVTSSRSYYAAGECQGSSSVSCAGRLKSITTEANDRLVDLAYAWDPNGNLVASRRDSNQSLYTHDLFDRLEREFVVRSDGSSGVTHEYTYDPLNPGNIRTHETPAGAVTYDYVGSRLDHIGDTTYVHDANGNQTVRTGSLAPRGHQTLQYNDFDMPHHIVTGEGGEELVTDLEYDALETRILRRDRRNGLEETTLYVGDLYERVVVDVGTAPAEHRYKLFAGNRQVGQVTRSGGNERINYLHDDHLGSVVLITDTNGDTVEERSYEPFGVAASADFRATEIHSSFTGHAEDVDLGLVNMRGRLYDAVVGRFTTPDPFVTEPLSMQGWNRYAYVQNNPLAFTDPSGFDLCAPSQFITPGTSCSDEPDEPEVDPLISNSSYQSWRMYQQAEERRKSDAMGESQNPNNQPSTLSNPAGRPLNGGDVNRFGEQTFGIGIPPVFDPRNAPGNGSSSLFTDPIDATYVEPAGGGLYRLNPAALEKLRPIFDIVAPGYDLGRVRLRFGRTAPKVPAYTWGDEITISKSSWKTRNPLAQLMLLAHEITHSAQFDLLGKGGLTWRRTMDSLKWGPFDQYDVNVALDMKSLSEIDIISPDFALEAIAEKVSQFVALPRHRR